MENKYDIVSSESEDEVIPRCIVEDEVKPMKNRCIIVSSESEDEVKPMKNRCIVVYSESEDEDESEEEVKPKRKQQRKQKRKHSKDEATQSKRKPRVLSSEDEVQIVSCSSPNGNQLTFDCIKFLNDKFKTTIGLSEEAANEISNELYDFMNIKCMNDFFNKKIKEYWKDCEKDVVLTSFRNHHFNKEIKDINDSDEMYCCFCLDRNGIGSFVVDFYKWLEKTTYLILNMNLLYDFNEPFFEAIKNLIYSDASFSDFFQQELCSICKDGNFKSILRYVGVADTPSNSNVEKCFICEREKCQCGHDLDLIRFECGHWCHECCKNKNIIDYCQKCLTIKKIVADLETVLE